MDSEMTEYSEPPNTLIKRIKTEIKTEPASEGSDSDLENYLINATLSPIPSPTIKEEFDIIEIIKHENSEELNEQADNPNLAVTNVKSILSQEPRNISSGSIPSSTCKQQSDVIIETITNEIGKQLNEKADKSNLTVAYVKSIIKQVLTKEHVRALQGKGETQEEGKTQIASYEPKLPKQSKAKELLSSNTIPVPSVNVPRIPQPPPSETHVLISEDSKENDSGYEYIPGQEEISEEFEESMDESIARESDISSSPTPVYNVYMKDQAIEITLPKTLMDVSIDHQQLCIIEQQMRQHVQILTQNFFLTYEHPEFNDYSATLKEYLLNLKFLSEGKTYSLFRPANLLSAIELVDDWIDLCASNCGEIQQTKEHIQQDLLKSIHYKRGGNYGFVVTFPKLMLEIISKSEVFLFPSLLPKIPFKSEDFSNGRCGFTDAEDRLLVFGIDQFKQFLSKEDERKGKKTPVPLNTIVSHVQAYIMPHRKSHAVLRHIFQSRHPRSATNPIQLYFLHGKLKPMVHYLYPLNEIVPPCKRMSEELPYQWKNFIYPPVLEENNIIHTPNNINISPMQVIVPQQLILINSPPLGGPLLIGPDIFTQPMTHPSRARTSLQKKIDSVATGGKLRRRKRGIKCHTV